MHPRRYSLVKCIIFSWLCLLIPAIVTTGTGHAIEIAQNIELTFDALVVVSGDGLVHEVLNGLAKHATPEKAFRIPIAPIPAGSGNGLSLNILGLHDGLDPCAAALNVLKGTCSST